MASSQSSDTNGSSQSLVLKLVEKVLEIDRNVREDVGRLHAENERLRELINEKALQLHVYSTRDEETNALIDEVKTRSLECEKYLS